MLCCLNLYQIAEKTTADTYVFQQRHPPPQFLSFLSRTTRNPTFPHPGTLFLPPHQPRLPEHVTSSAHRRSV